MKIPKTYIAAIVVTLFVSAGLKIWLMVKGVIPFNSDEAIVGLMARHILMGERPVFFYGQAYMGSLDAYLVAFGFSLFGQSIWVIRFVQILLYIGTIITTLWIGVTFFKSYRTGLYSIILLAVPSVTVTLYTTASLGGYGEALLIGNLILASGFWLIREFTLKPENKSRRIYGIAFFYGLMVGLGIWANGLTLVYSIPTSIFLFFSYVRMVTRSKIHRHWIPLAAAATGLVAGSCPWWVFALHQGWGDLLSELLGSAVSVEQGGFLSRIISHFLNLSLLGSTVIFGLRPSWEIFWIALPLAPLVLVYWIFTIWFFIRSSIVRSENRQYYQIMGGVWLTISAGFLFTSFGIDPSGRYFLPLVAPLALVGSQMVEHYIRKSSWQAFTIFFLVIFNFIGTLQSANRYPPGITTQFDSLSVIDHRYDVQLINFLEQEGEYRGYTNYWVAYPLAFLTQEKMIYVPKLPYHPDLRYTSRDDRYLPYNELVKTGDRSAYITSRSTKLDDLIRMGLKEKNVLWSEKKIGDYQIFFHISENVSPEDLELGTHFR